VFGSGHELPGMLFYSISASPNGRFGETFFPVRGGLEIRRAQRLELLPPLFFIPPDVPGPFFADALVWWCRLPCPTFRPPWPKSVRMQKR